MESGKLSVVEDEDGAGATFIFRDEGHTLGNVLRYLLVKE